MSVEIRTVEPEEIGKWGRSVGVAFLHPPSRESDQEGERHEPPPPGRAWAAVDGDRFVGNAATLPRTVNLPAPAGADCLPVPMAGVTAVGVHPSHRRQGILRRMMAAMLDDARERGEPLAGLLPSESVIYGRYGFGVATFAAKTEIATARSAFGRPVAPADVRIVDPEEASKLIPSLFAGAIRRTPGQVDRPDVVWERYVFADHADWRHGHSANFYAVAADGYAIYRVEEPPGSETARLHVRDVCASTADAEAALWRFLLDVDLVDGVVGFPRPVPDPLSLRLADPRQLRTTVLTDFLWLRVLDTAAVLTGRGYRSSGRLVLAVEGADDPAAGTWVLEAGPDGASCERARAGASAASVDLRLGLPELASLALGTLPASALAGAGRLVEERPGALDDADVLLRAGPVAPFDLTSF
ncbi:MAG: GNAT family N-acetyltransferase [Acidimicrobiales bacterium]